MTTRKVRHAIASRSVSLADGEHIVRPAGFTPHGHYFPRRRSRSFFV